MSALTDRLREQRNTARTTADEILTRASSEERDLTTAELADHRDAVDAEREAADELDRIRDDQIADLRASTARNGGRQVLSRQSAETARAFRSAIFSKNPAPIEVYAPDLADEWPSDMPEPIKRSGKVRVHTRDTLKSTATQALGVDVFTTIQQKLVENSAVLAAGATLVTTDTGEDLVVPKDTAYVTSALTAEGASITESDPTLATVTLKAYKYSSFFQISRELADDSPTNLLSYLADGAATSLALAYGPHLITGTGSSQPNGLVTAGTAFQGPVGSSTSLGTQTSAGLGTDVIFALIGNLAEPYARRPATGFILNNATLNTKIRSIKDSAGQPITGLVGVSGAPNANQIFGYDAYVDPNVANMAANAKSMIFGDLSRYFVRVVGSVRFERSDEFAFKDDLVSFRCIIRLDANLVDTNGIRIFQNSPT
jgi:HK97 family phage major capsid protein